MDWSKFISMGGYGFYVWGSYLVALIAIGGEVLLVMRRKKNLIKQFNGRTGSIGSEFK